MSTSQDVFLSPCEVNKYSSAYLEKNPNTKTFFFLELQELHSEHRVRGGRRQFVDYWNQQFLIETTSISENDP